MERQKRIKQLQSTFGVNQPAAQQIDRIVSKKEYMKQKFLNDELKAVLTECEKIVSDWKHSDGADIRLQRLYRMQVNH